MNKFFTNILIILEVGGGFMGFSVILASQPWNKHINPFVYSGASLLFMFGIFAGLALIKESRCGIVSSAIYQALQVPFISSHVISYNILSGIKLVVGVLRGMPYVTIDIGARVIIVFGGETDSWGFGINLIALILFVYLIFQFLEKLDNTESNSMSGT